MAIIDVDRMYKEMRDTMQNNFQGNALERFEKAKKLYLETVEDIINQNRDELLKEVDNGKE